MIAVVTGAGRGIGKAIAALFLRNGMRVVLAEKDSAAGQSAEKELLRYGDAVFIRTDVAREPSVRSLFAEVLRRYGEINVLVNNAAEFRFKPLAKTTLRDWNAVIETNLTGNFLCTKAAAPHLKKTKGCIVNISSTRAIMSEPDKEAYAASKGGIVSLTHSLALSLGPDVRVNCVTPDWIDTGKEPIRPKDHKQFPVGRVGSPEDVARTVLFLTDPRNSFITGVNFVLDGGKTRQMTYV